MQQSIQSSSKRFRDYGFDPGILPVGAKNLISDVPGVTVGHLTKVEGQSCRTGVTVVDPGVVDLATNKLPAAGAVGNGHGKVAGFTQLNELGTLDSPIALTNTLAVGPVVRGVVDLALSRESLTNLATVNAVVGEINDGRVNDIYKNFLQPEDVARAANNLSQDFELGSVGGGTGGRAFSWKGGIGSASRQLTVAGQVFTLGAMVQTNFGGSLTIMGVPIGQMLGRDDFNFLHPQSPDGSCMIVLATDAPLSARQLRRIAQRGLFGMVRTGAIMAHASGDYAVAFSTSRAGLEVTSESCLEDEWLNGFFLAAIEAVEESIYDAMFVAQTMHGHNGGRLERLPVDRVVELIRKRQ